jgi:hypothetical protein
MIVESQNATAETKVQPGIRPTLRRSPSDAKRLHEEVVDIGKFLVLAVQLVLLAVLIRRYNVESVAFFQLTILAFAGFAIHYFLPLDHRLTFFLLLSLSAIVLVLGVGPATWLVGIGVMVIGVCHLPLALSIRVALLAVIGGFLIAMRHGVIPNVVPAAIWPILGSMFVFRLVLYLRYYKTGPVSPAKSLSYFFMLPNVCFPFFPVVDYQSFARNYYNEDRYKIYQVGTRWIFRGIVHLILYRIIYKNWSISLYDVENAGDFVHYCLWSYLLYLRVSGMFHIIVGMLHLFGFNLPETHHLYFLSSSFLDFYRRINIYWKDFMMKVFFYPAYFRVRQLGPLASLLISTLIVFFATWFLHAVQWYCLRGTFLISGQDILFWCILAGLVIVNSVWEFKRGKQGTISLGGVSWKRAIGTGLKTLATFTVICLLWSMWSSESLSAWWTLKDYALVAPTFSGWLLIAATAIIIVGAAVLLARNPQGLSWSYRSPMREAVVQSILMLLLSAVSIGAVNRRLGYAGEMIDSAKTGDLNLLDLAELERGYYENLMDVDRFNGELSRLYSRRPPDWNNDITSAGCAELTDNLLHYELKPSMHGHYKGVAFDTNQWGMHDEEYTQKRPPGCYRIALLGASHGMATGIDIDRDFETLVENRLNRENDGKVYSSYQILNFAVEGYAPVKQVWVLEKKALAFEPNAIMYVGHTGDDKRVAQQVFKWMRDGVDLHDPYLNDLVRRANVNKDMPEAAVRRRLAPFGEELLTWTYRKMVEISQAHGIRPIFLLLPQLNVSKDPTAEIRRAEDAGFTVLNLSDVYQGHAQRMLWVTEWDAHPNTLGHELLAQRLYELIHEKQILPISATPSVKSVK